jgi:hypothetical protein
MESQHRVDGELEHNLIARFRLGMRLIFCSDEPPNFSRNAAVIGAGAAAGAGGAYAATRPHDNVEESTHTDRSFPLSGGSVAPHSENRPASSTYSSEAPVEQSTSGSTGHIAGLNTGTAGGVGAASGDAALANLGLERHSDGQVIKTNIFWFLRSLDT